MTWEQAKEKYSEYIKDDLTEIQFDIDKYIYDVVVIKYSDLPYEFDKFLNKHWAFSEPNGYDVFDFGTYVILVKWGN